MNSATGKRSTAKGIIIDYLSSMFLQRVYQISSHDFEIKVVQFGKDMSHQEHMEVERARIWRKLKETGKIPELDVFSIDTVKNKSAETTWVLRTRR